MIIAVTFSGIANGNAKAEVVRYSGEEIFKGFVFAQGNVGEKLPEIFDQSMVDKLNSPESIKFADDIVAKIKTKKPNYFKELQKAVYEKKPAKIDKLLKDAGKIIEKDIEESTKTMSAEEKGAIGLGTYTQNESVLYYYYYGVAGIAVFIVLTAIDLNPIAAADNYDREMAIGTLVDNLN